MLPAEMLARLERRVGQTINEKYRLDALLGVGGMAAVYAATHRNGRQAAVKVLHVELSRDKEIRARFLREGYVANKINHEGLVRIIDDDVDADGSAYLVMDLLVGATLEAARVAAGGRLALDAATNVADQVLDALAAAHAEGIIHRDIKPENVFLTSDGPVKVMDFGIARVLDATVATRTGALMGTPAFMPPEQAAGRNKEVDARTDVWSVGALLFVVLTGQEVHQARTSQLQLIYAATQPARSIATVIPTLPPVLARVIDTALAFEPAKRWPSASAMRDALASAAPRSGVTRGRVAEPTETVLSPLSSPGPMETLIHGSGTEPSGGGGR